MVVQVVQDVAVWCSWGHVSSHLKKLVGETVS
jgi:hypothetical protein